MCRQMERHWHAVTGHVCVCVVRRSYTTHWHAMTGHLGVGVGMREETHKTAYRTLGLKSDVTDIYYILCGKQQNVL